MSDILIGRNDGTEVCLESRYGNRRGMAAGATGTGKSGSPMLFAEGSSRLGAPCELANVKGDLAGPAMPASEPGDKREARPSKLRLAHWQAQANTVIYPDDVPEEILDRLGSRIPYALQACTPRDPKAVRAAARAMGSQIGRQILPGLLGVSFGGRR